MPMVNEDILNASNRRQITLERLKKGNQKNISEYLSELDKELILIVTKAGELQDLSKKQLNSLIAEVNIAVNKYSDRVIALSDDTSKDLLPLESEFNANLLNRVIKTVGYSAIALEADFLYSKYYNAILNEGNGKATTVPKAESKLKSSNSAKIEGAINSSFSNALNTTALLTVLRGTKQNRFTDGVFLSISNASNTLSNSLLQHASVTAKAQTGIKNGVKRYTWLATIDGRTTSQCRSLDELDTIYVFGQGPLPPLHYNCRSSIIYIIDGRLAQTENDGQRIARNQKGKTVLISSETGYYTWLRTQPKQFQVDVLGKTRANLFSNGGLSSKQFAKLNVNKNYEPITIDEMRKRNSTAFELAGI